jgi:putative ABC transport system ATP-binding protein
MNIDARQISLVYQARQGEPTMALDKMDVSAGPGAMVGVIGPPGSGKSSLLYVMSGLKKPSTGAVFFDDADISQWNAEELEAFRRKNFGFIFQRHYLVSHLTILENILLPLDEPSAEDRARALCLLERLHPGLPADKMPGELSVGQRQLAAVARALINSPRAIFADEPTAALDMDTGMRVMDAIAEAAADAAVIVVTHDMKMLKNARRIIKLRDGKQV